MMAMVEMEHFNNGKRPYNNDAMTKMNRLKQNKKKKQKIKI